MESNFFYGIGKMLIVVGIVFVLIGMVLVFADRLPFRVGRLPGDIFYRRGNFTFYFPWVTSIVVSLFLTILFWLIGRR
jgi:hypothetical protein